MEFCNAFKDLQEMALYLDTKLYCTQTALCKLLNSS